MNIPAPDELLLLPADTLLALLLPADALLLLPMDALLLPDGETLAELPTAELDTPADEDPVITEDPITEDAARELETPAAEEDDDVTMPPELLPPLDEVLLLPPLVVDVQARAGHTRSRARERRMERTCSSVATGNTVAHHTCGRPTGLTGSSPGTGRRGRHRTHHPQC